MITTKEVLLIQDNIKMFQNLNDFLSACMQGTSDQQLKDLCSTMVTEHKNNIQVLSKFITNSNIQ